MLIQSTSFNNYPPQFKSTRQCVKDSLGRVVNCHYTNLNRGDVNWEKLAKTLADRFKTQEKVIINLFGCSDGSDAYTLNIALRNVLKEKASKFFIKASDISPSLIEKAQKGEILLYDKDFEFLESKNSRQFFKRDYTKPIENMRNIDFYPHKVDEELRKNMSFSVKDVRKEAQEHDFSDEVFIFRNGWTFMDLNTQNEIVKNLSKNSNAKTLFLIGQSDLFKSNACEYFQRNGFKGIDSEIFTRAETNYPSISIGMPAQKSSYPEFILFEKK
ncbi:MAG: hypothetical protein E7Z89_07565 [Cyanobacteria bacterium SIG28]|nr:hypothetical protein [Cyanobacteria bacterium SIG28]